MATALTMHGHECDDAWPRVRRCLAGALTMHGHGADEAGMKVNESEKLTFIHLIG